MIASACHDPILTCQAMVAALWAVNTHVYVCDSNDSCWFANGERMDQMPDRSGMRVDVAKENCMRLLTVSERLTESVVKSHDHVFTFHIPWGHLVSNGVQV